MSAALNCPICSTPWPSGPEVATLPACPGCAREVRVRAFPALFRVDAPVPTSAGDAIVMEGEASCFYHAGKRATVPCSSCGRFLCSLCDVKLGDRNLCPSCIEAGRTKGKITEFESSRTLWDSTALMLTLLPLVLCFYATIVTAPAAIVVTIIGWKKPKSLVRKTNARFVLALVIATLEIAAWIVFFTMLAKNADF